MKEAHERI